MTSEALAALKDRLAEVRLLVRGDPLRPGHVESDRQSHEVVPLSNALNRAAVVLACAHLEGFLEDLLIEAIDFIVSAAPPVERLPIILRALHAEAHLGPLELTRDRNARAVKIRVMFEAENEIWQPGKPVTQGMLRAATVASQMSNPGSKEVRRFLELIGVNIESYLESRGTPSLLKRIDSLVMKRNSVAHGERTAVATHADIDGYLETLRELAIALTRAVAESVRDVCGQTHLPWAI